MKNIVLMTAVFFSVSLFAPVALADEEPVNITPISETENQDASEDGDSQVEQEGSFGVNQSDGNNETANESADSADQTSNESADSADQTANDNTPIIFPGAQDDTSVERTTAMEQLIEIAQGGGDIDQFILDQLSAAERATIQSAAQTAEGGTGNPEGLVTCSGLDCDACALVSMIDEIIDWLIIIMLSVFAIVVVYAGFLLVTSGGSVEAKTKARSMMTNAIVGLIIVLAAWILIDTLIRAITPGDTGEIGFGARLQPWNEVQCTPANNAPATPID